ncbi:hypothetical protein [Acidianus sp. HS-5]|uniref:hypothetical protein n=1 Tax=Acidianus sp. HS-5 TaxID=2886040 RepID=UPI001F3C7EAC|nr:hypothetical protein [Acidianus sp. HS-5]BDC18752.1 hypothetical protein HS5_16420 [Acidianus sp. HS-5]
MEGHHKCVNLDKEEEWYYKTDFLAPTTGFISQRLDEQGKLILHWSCTDILITGFIREQAIMSIGVRQ